MVDQPSQQIVINGFSFDPTNKAPNYNIYKQTNVLGILPTVNIGITFEFSEKESVADVRKHAAAAAIQLLREVIEALEKQG
jgi:hypothetical protein